MRVLDREEEEKMTEKISEEKKNPKFPPYFGKKEKESDNAEFQ